MTTACPEAGKVKVREKKKKKKILYPVLRYFLSFPFFSFPFRQTPDCSDILTIQSCSRVVLKNVMYLGNTYVLPRNYIIMCSVSPVYIQHATTLLLIIARADASPPPIINNRDKLSLWSQTTKTSTQTTSWASQVTAREVASLAT